MKDSQARVEWTFSPLWSLGTIEGLGAVMGYFGKTSQPTIIGWIIQGEDR